jgi:hypothetical protein
VLPLSFFSGLVARVSNVEVKPVTRSQCAPFILGIHYARRWPSISYAFGLFDESELVGVVTYGAPPSRHLQVGCCKSSPDSVIELNRLCLKYNRKNEASRLISGSLKLLPPLIVVSYSDTAHGHYGGVYRAANFRYAGWTDMERKTARLDYISGSGRHSRDAFRNGSGRKSETVRRKPKAKYWTVTGGKRDRKRLERNMSWPSISWREYPVPSEHRKCIITP